jgi:hypothetical protein
MEFPEGAYAMAPGRSLCPLGAFLVYANETFLKLTNFSPLLNKSKVEGGKEHV